MCPKLDYKWHMNIVLISFPFFLLVPYALAWFCFTLHSSFCWTCFMVLATGKKHIVARLGSSLYVKSDTWLIWLSS